jgi:hypothetical protein
MLAATDRRHLVHTLLSLAVFALALALAVLFLVELASPTGRAQEVRPAARAKADDPVYTDYKGVRLGAAAEEVRAKLCKAVSETNEEDFHVVSDSETAQIFYDEGRKVRALVVMYTAGGPTPESVLGRAAEVKADGSQHLKVSYERAGYWVAYTRTAGDTPVVTVAMQAMKK